MGELIEVGKWLLAFLSGIFLLYVILRIASSAVFRSYFDAKKLFHSNKNNKNKED